MDGDIRQEIKTIFICFLMMQRLNTSRVKVGQSPFFFI